MIGICVNNSNHSNVINKTCTSSQYVSTSSLWPNQRKNFSAILRLHGFLAMSTNVTWFPTIEESHHITLTISNMMSWNTTIEAFFTITLSFICTMTNTSTIEALDRSRSLSPTWSFFILSLLFTFVRWRTMWFHTILITTLTLTNALVVIRSSMITKT